MTVESSQSEPFIVMTNTKQWDEAQGFLLKKDIFFCRLEVSASQFCNILQRHYMQASRQDSLKAIRPLGPSGFDFLFSTKIGKNFCISELLARKDFDHFWIWFGPTLQKIRITNISSKCGHRGYFGGLFLKQNRKKFSNSMAWGRFCCGLVNEWQTGVWQ